MSTRKLKRSKFELFLIILIETKYETVIGDIFRNLTQLYFQRSRTKEQFSRNKFVKSAKSSNRPHHHHVQSKYEYYILLKQEIFSELKNFKFFQFND